MNIHKSTSSTCLLEKSKSTFYCMAGPWWKGAFWLVLWAVHILPYGSLSWTAHKLISLIDVLEKVFKMNLLALSRNLFLVIRLNILSELLRKWRDKNNFSHLIVAHAFRRQIYRAVRKFKKKNVIKPLLNYVHVSCLFRTGMQLGHKLAKKELDQYFPSTDLTLVQ